MDGKNKDKLVSIITPTYNSSKYLSETIDSVLKQSHTNWEWIIIDDCSNDGTQQIIIEASKLDSRIRYLSTRKNTGGPATPRNIGLDNASGEFICFLDSDDVWLPDKIKIQLEQINENDGICSNYNVIDSQSKYQKTVNNKLKKIILDLFLGKETILYFNYVNINTAMIRNTGIQKFDQSSNLIAIEDYIFWINYLKKGHKIKLLKNVLVNYRVHNEAISQWSNTTSYKKTINFFRGYRAQKKISFMTYLSVTVVIRFRIFFVLCLRIYLEAQSEYSSHRKRRFHWFSYRKKTN